MDSWKRKGFSLFFLALFSSLLVVSAAAAFSGSGSGSASNPYIIMTADQLNEVRDELDAAYRLGADIDLDVAPYNTGQGWIAIGDTTTPFIGTFDGNWHIIRNLFTTGGNYDYIGLFGVLGDSLDLAEPFLVKNLLLEDVDVGSPYYSGGLAGMSFDGTVENCGVTGSVSGYTNVGGLIGIVSTETTIRRCFSKGSVQGGSFVGGLVGAIYSTSILNSYSLADVEATSTVCGGLVGLATQLSIGDSYAAGAVTGPDGYKGGLIGKTGSDVTVVDSYYDEDVAGVPDNTWGSPKSTAEMKTQSTFSGWDFDAVWAMDSGVNEGYPYLQWEENYMASGSSSGCSAGLPVPLFLLLLAPLALLGRKAGK